MGKMYLTGQLAKKLSERLGRHIAYWQVRYHLKHRGIPAAGQLGRYSVYGEDAVEALAAALA